MPTKPTVIRFFAPVIEVTINTLMSAIDQKMGQGVTEFVILVSSPGGSVLHGLSAYNYLKGLPISLTTHNFGSVDSNRCGTILRRQQKALRSSSKVSAAWRKCRFPQRAFRGAAA